MILWLHESLQAKFAVSGKDIPGNVSQTLYAEVLAGIKQLAKVDHENIAE